MENILSNITALPGTKREQAIFIDRAVQELLSGNYDLINMAVLFDTVKKTLEKIMQDQQVKQALESELMKYPGKTIEFGSFSITKGSRTTYDYSNDHVWTDLKSQLANREALLKAVKGTIYEDDGVVITPPASKINEFITIKLK